MNPFTNSPYLEQLHCEAAQHRNLEPLRLQDRSSLFKALSELFCVARRWTVGDPTATARRARGMA
jgi:hypothetical protein